MKPLSGVETLEASISAIPGALATSWSMKRSVEGEVITAESASAAPVSASSNSGSSDRAMMAPAGAPAAGARGGA